MTSLTSTDLSANSHHRLAAVLFCDIVGYSQMMHDNERITLDLLKSHNEALFPIVEAHHGKVIKTIGDAILAVFDSSIFAVKCGIAVQEALASSQTLHHPTYGKMRVRIGIHLGEITFNNGDAFGTGVNVAARLQNLADPGGICVSQIVAEQISAHIERELIPIGPVQLKNIPSPVSVYRIQIDVPPELDQTQPIISRPMDQPVFRPANIPPSPVRTQTSLPPLRVSQLALESTIQRLEANFAQGNLDLADYESRIEAALVAQSQSELDSLTSDLPELPSPMGMPSFEIPEIEKKIAIFSGANQSGPWIPPKEMKVVAVFGGVELDYREARLMPGPIDIKVTTVFGGLEITVPPGLPVVTNVTSIFGGTQSVAESVPKAGEPYLRITGIVVFGGIDIKVKEMGKKVKEILRVWAEKIINRFTPQTKSKSLPNQDQ